MNTASTNSTSLRQKEFGLCAGLLSYLWWGFMPVYFKFVATVPALLLIAYRVIWSFSLLAILALLLVPREEITAVLRSRRTLLMLCLSTVCLAMNWGMFIWSVSSGRVVQSSLGYFINPLLSVALAVVLLKERLRVGQCVGLVLALIGVIVLTIVRGQLPLIALTIAFSFGGYGLIRKIVHIAPIVGLAFETALLLPIAIGYILLRHNAGYPTDAQTRFILPFCGLITTVPLLAYAAAMRRLKLSTMGFMQYIVPTCQLLLAIFVYHEHFDRGNFIGFACIWAALIVYTLDSLHAFRSPVAPAEESMLAAEIS